jgi:pyruvate formate lyase activating enzyme
MGSVDSIETFGLVDGPGIRTVVFLSGCQLRCKYCHNPEMWIKGKDNYTPEELVKKIIRFKPYFKRNNGGVTFSGGEPLNQIDFLIETCKLLKKENINITLDTAGVGIGKYEELLKYIDLILFDVKHTNHQQYRNLTGKTDDESFKFLKIANKLNKNFWIRQVIVPNLMDNEEYIISLNKYLKENIKNIQKIEFLPYHKLGSEKYLKLGLNNPYKDMPEMNKEKCQELYEKFINIYNKK